MCQSGYLCGGRMVAVWPLPGTNAYLPERDRLRWLSSPAPNFGSG